MAFATYQNTVGVAAPVQYATQQQFAAPQAQYATQAAPVSYSTMQAPLQYAAPQLQYATQAAPQVEYVTAAPAVEYMTQAQPQYEYIEAPPAVEYMTQAPMVEYVTQQGLVEEIVYAAPQVTTAPRNLLAMGQVVSERVITIDELAMSGRYEATEAVMAVAEPQRVEYVQQQPMVEYVTAAQPTYAQPMAAFAPQTMTMAQPTYAQPMAFAQQTMTMAQPTYAQPATYAQPMGYGQTEFIM